METIFGIVWGLFAIYYLVTIPLNLRESIKGYRLAGHRYTLKQAVVDLAYTIGFFLLALTMFIENDPFRWAGDSKPARSWISAVALPFMLIGIYIEMKRMREANAHIEKRSGIDFDKY